MKFACPEIHQRPVSACGNIVGTGSATGAESALDGAGPCRGGESCARAPEAANEQAPSTAQSPKTNRKVESRISSFPIPPHSLKAWLAIRTVQAKLRLIKGMMNDAPRVINNL